VIDRETPIKDQLTDPVSEEAVARVWQRIDARFPRGRRPRRVPVWSVALLAGAAAAATVVSVVSFRDAGPLRLADGSAVVAVTAPAGGEVVSMADGSRIELGAGASFEPLESTGTSFIGSLQRGSAGFEVHPGGPRRWQIECGLATVEVVGTHFSCDRAPGRLRVAVQRGVVLVRGERVPDRARRLAAGESLEVIDPTAAPEAPSAAPVTTAAAGGDVVPAAPEAALDDAPDQDDEARAAEPAGTPAVGRTHGAAHGGAWRELARDGRHSEAFAALGAQGIRRETRRLGVTDLLALADVARLSGHPAEAVPPLERILRDFSSDAQAPLAAFTLGRLELDALHRPARAAGALERALTLGVPRSLREDVRARLVEAYAAAGQRAAAHAAADAYTREFPNGRYAARIESQLR
jgi:transmembrane sensor